MDHLLNMFYQDDNHLSEESLVEEVAILSSPHKESTISKNGTEGAKKTKICACQATRQLEVHKKMLNNVVRQKNQYKEKLEQATIEIQTLKLQFEQLKKKLNSPISINNSTIDTLKTPAKKAFKDFKN